MGAYTQVHKSVLHRGISLLEGVPEPNAATAANDGRGLSGSGAVRADAA